MSYSVSSYQQTLLFCGVVVDYLSETQHSYKTKETLTLLLHLELIIDQHQCHQKLLINLNSIILLNQQ